VSEVTLLATATFGLEAVLSRELERLGFAERTVADGRVRFRAAERDICRANLWLRTADRVLCELGRFEARDFGALFEATRALPWHAWLPPDAAFPVRGKSVRSALHGVPACQRIVKKAIVEALRAGHRRRELPETGAAFPVEVSIVRDEVTLALDTSGAGLHKRGWRVSTRAGTAPLKETLAAGLVLLSGWRADGPLVDPFCGTGTIAIEAALLARNAAPGLDRGFAAERWPRLRREEWARAREEARDARRRDGSVAIVASDADPAVVRAARRHGERAGVAADVRFSVRDARALRLEAPAGAVVTNPPYGERSGERAEAAALHRILGRWLAAPGWSFGVLAAGFDLERLVHRRATRRRKLYNGGIACTYYLFMLPRQGS
jgi:putative N6-adenine-specific DNA methylase